MDASEGSLQGVATVASPQDRGLVPPFIVIACSVVFFWSISFRAMIYTMMPTIAADLHLTNSMAGLVIADMLLGYCVGSWVVGWLPSSRKRRIMAGVLLSLVGAALFTQAGNLPVLLVAALVAGVGVGLYLSLGLSILVEAGGSNRKAYYMAVHEVAATTASFCGSTFVAVALSWIDWRGSLLAWCTVGIVAILVFTRVRDRGESGHGGGNGHRVQLDRTMVYSVLSFGVATTLVMGLISVLPLIMVRAWNLDQAMAAQVVGSSRLAGLVGVAAVGLIADRWGHVRVLLLLQLLCLVGVGAMSVGGYGPFFQIGLLVLAAGASGNIALVPIVVATAYSPEKREKVISAASGVGGILGLVVAPAIFGGMLDLGLDTAPIQFAVVATVGTILITTRVFARSAGRGG